MDAQIKKGLLDACVLKLLARSTSYGYAITAEMQQVLEVSESSLYPVLRRLEQSGCLATFQRPHNGRMRKYYSITPDGKRKLVEIKDEWGEVLQVIEFVMNEGESA